MAETEKGETTLDKLDREINKIVDEIIASYIWRNLTKGISKRYCICGCKQDFVPRSKYHHFYSRACYSRMHRLRGFVKRVVDHRD